MENIIVLYQGNTRCHQDLTWIFQDKKKEEEKLLANIFIELSKFSGKMTSVALKESKHCA